MVRETARKGRPRSFGGAAAGSTIQALDRAFSVLEALAGANGLTLSELARQLGQSPATIYRVLGTLEAHGMAEVDPPTQAWFVGAGAFRLGSAFLRRANVIERSQPALRQLMRATGETSNLGIERDGEVLFVSQAEAAETIRAFFPPGTVSPMHASGIGKALLGTYGEAALAQFLRGRRLARFTDKTITDPAALTEALRRDRARGYAIDDEEKAIGMRCIAAPILNVHDEAVAGISVSGPTHRITSDRVAEIGRLVGDAAREISRGLGYRPADPMPL